MPAVAIGKDVVTGTQIFIDDLERRGGMYIAGIPQIGKSTLLIWLALQDIRHRHGLLFIDPHADAIDELLKRIPPERQRDVLLLDPTDETHAFSVNVLACANPQSLKERNITFSSAIDIFIKLFPNPQTGKLDILLSKYLRNSFYPLIEKQGYTLADIPLFLMDDDFRESILKQVSYNPEVMHFWHREFAQLDKNEQRKEIESTLNRLNPLLTRDYTKYMVSQVENTVDFGRWMDEKKIVLLRMPTWLDEEIRSFIGTILLSQLLKATFLRAENPAQERTLFGLYCDEFHLFATPDFAKLFTQTAKFYLMPTVAHQTRLGQLESFNPNLGATLAAPIKVLFRQTVDDSDKFAPEYAKAPPTEIKRERLLVISQEPVKDLVRGHADPEIRRFVREYLLSLLERLEDTKEAMERERILHQYRMDVAALYRLFTTEEDTYGHIVRNPAAVAAAAAAVRQAQQHTRHLFALFEHSQPIRLVVRALNHFLTALMEGRIRQGEESYAEFLLQLLSAFFPTSEVLSLYISLAYGDPILPRSLSVALANRCGLFQKEIAALKAQAEAQTNRERRALQDRFVEEDRESARGWRSIAETEFAHKQGERRVQVDKQIGSMHGNLYQGPWNPVPLYSKFIWLECYPGLRSLLAPVSRAHFTGISQVLGRSHQSPWDVDTLIQNIEAKFQGKRWKYEPLYYMRRDYIARLFSFLRTHKEGAFVMLAFLDVATYGTKGWEGFRPSNVGWSRYPNLCMLDFPQIDALDPIETLRLIQKINDFIISAPVIPMEMYARYFGWQPDALSQLFSAVGRNKRLRASAAEYLYEVEKAMQKDYRGWVWGDFAAFPFTIGELIKRFEERESIKELRPEASVIKSILEETWDTFSRQNPIAADVWKGADALTRAYLIAHACDRACFGSDIADLTFPLPRVSGAEEFIASVVNIIEEILERTYIVNERQDEAYWRRAREAERSRALARISHTPPAVLTARRLNVDEREKIKNTCLQELSGSRELEVLTEFFEFCDLLTKPENLVQIGSTQYREIEVPSRPEHDMVGEMRRELLNLPKHTAYVKFNVQQGGIQTVGKTKIQTFRLPKALIGRAQAIQMARKNAIDDGILRERQVIAGEIRKRQERLQRCPAVEDSRRKQDKMPDLGEPPPTVERRPPTVEKPAANTPLRQEPVGAEDRAAKRPRRHETAAEKRSTRMEDQIEIRTIPEAMRDLGFSPEAVQVMEKASNKEAAGAESPAPQARPDYETLIYIAVLVDDSYSISGTNKLKKDNTQDVIDGHNRIIDALKLAVEAPAMLFKTQFFNNETLLNNWVRLSEARYMSAETFHPSGVTSLYDKTLKVLGSLMREKANVMNAGQHVRWGILVISDGEDTCSEQRAQDVKQVLDDLKDKGELLQTCEPGNYTAGSIAFLGIDDGSTPFEDIAHAMGINWVLRADRMDETQIRRAFNTFSEMFTSAIR